MRRLTLIAAAALVFALDSHAAKPPADPEQSSFAKLSGKELVKQLADDKSRPRAFYELLRRVEPGKHADFKTFEVGHYNSRLLVCRQEKPRLPIYLVLYGFEGETETEASSDAYVVKKPSELFPPTPPGPGGAAEREPAICAFTAEGRIVRPFGYDTVLSNGTLSDINGDELIERVDSRTYGVEGGGTATILTVSAVKAKAEPILTLLLNWDNDEWTYRLTDQDGDGVSDIEAGPRTAAGLIPKAVWKWDRAKHAYVGTPGKSGDHFRIINSTNLWKEFRRLKAERLTFPKDADAISEYEARPESTIAPTPPSLPADPYHYSSLKDASDAELFQFMAQGKSEFYRDLEKNRPRLPENFWTMDGKSAALALVEINRTDKHRAHYQIAIDDRDQAEPPQRCTIAFSDSSARCYNAVDGHYFVRVDPDDSYLAFAGSSAAGVVFYNAIYDQPVFDLRICPLPYERARQLAHIVWWLDRVRSRAVSTNSETERIITTGGGRGHFVMRVNDQAVIDHANGLGNGLNDSWVDNYTPETFLNLASYLVTNALPASLGRTWSQFEPTEQRPSEMRETSAPVYADAERKRLQDFAERFLSWFAVSQERISFPVVSQAAQLIGDFGIVSDAPRLREIDAALPSPAPRKRSFDEISAERNKLPQPFDIKNPKKRKRVEEQRAALDAESDAALYDDISGSPDLLRQALTVSLRKLAMATDLPRLSTIAVSDADDGQWALRRLAQLDRKRYADALETLIRKTKAKWARQFYDALVRVDQTRAATIARELPADQIDALTLPAFLVLREVGVVPDEPQRLATIIKMLHDPKTDWLERAHVIEALVPLDNALLYPGREIDEALLTLFECDQADESGTFSLEEACLALARRGRTETFDRIVEQLQAVQGKGNYDRVLEALTYLAQQAPGQFNPRLVEIVRPHLSHTNKSVPDLMWMIWSANLRELEPELQHLATSGPSVFEDYKAHASGGVASDVTGRFHLARKILHLWSEADALTRAKLLVIFAATEAEEFFRNPHPERVTRMKAEMNRAAEELSPDAKQTLRAFIAAIDSNPDSIDEARVDPEMIHKATAFAGTELKL